MKHVPLILLLAVAALLTASCSAGGEEESNEVTTILGMNVSNGTVITNTDSHGGFHGDGVAFLEIQFDDESCLNQIEGSSTWRELPVSENVKALIYGSGMAGPYITEGGNTLFPQADNGYYYFQDRHSKSTNPKDDSQVLGRASFNLTVALYDSDEQTLYYCEFDT